MDKAWKVVLAFVVIFMAGAGTGSLIALRYAQAFLPQPRQPGAVVERFGLMQMQRLTDQLDLTDAQREKIKPIVQKAGADLRRLSTDSQHETRDILTAMHDQVAALLTPEQNKKFDEIRLQMQKRMNQQFQGGGRWPGGQGPMNGRSQGPGGPGSEFHKMPRSVLPDDGTPQLQPQPQPAGDAK
jgi:Spy/CpxP family protein refolding chaperone